MILPSLKGQLFIPAIFKEKRFQAILLINYISVFLHHIKSYCDFMILFFNLFSISAFYFTPPGITTMPTVESWLQPAPTRAHPLVRAYTTTHTQCVATWQMNPVEVHCRTQRLNFLFFLFLSSLSVQVVINTGSSSIKGSWRTWNHM